MNESETSQRPPGAPQHAGATRRRGAWAANLLNLDYEREAARLGPPPVPIIDIHSHINGPRAAGIYDRVRALYGVRTTFSMTQIDQAADVRAVLGDSIQYIAIPTYMHPDRRWAMTDGFLENIRRFRGDFGARIVKFWAAPRQRDLLEEAAGPGVDMADVAALDSPWKIRAAELAASLGMMFMVHIADPDTWFATKYADAARYGTKRDQYAPLHRMLERFRDSPWIAAHMGGWPEDLDFLSELLERHPNLYLDTSATKWMVRELSKHPRDELIAFLKRWNDPKAGVDAGVDAGVGAGVAAGVGAGMGGVGGRILFGSDIVTTDEHLKPDADSSRFGKGAESEHQAFELYASRYWALRTLWETDYDGPSPIADPDLALVDPARHDALSSPRLTGKNVPPDLLRSLYSGAAGAFLSGSKGGDPRASNRLSHEAK